MIETPSRPTDSERLEGVVDDLKGDALLGWAWSAQPGQPPLRIEVRVDQVLIGSGEAALFRADLAAAGKREGHCGFAIALDRRPAPGAVLQVLAIGPSQTLELVGSPFTVATPRPAQLGTAITDVLPLPLGSARLHGSLDQCGPTTIRGWARWLDGTGRPATLSLHEGERELLRFEASQWRADIAELQSDDGCCGFELALPVALRDGQLHVLELRLAETGTALLAAPLRMRAAAALAQVASRVPSALPHRSGPAEVTLSVLVNFYNMQREAARTLASLASDYQLGASDFSYEVLCIDNGSEPPLDQAWIESFGPQFRLLQPSRRLPSPCAALNEAALQARGEYLAVMIDGAHLLTPGVFQEARQAWQHDPDAVVALRHWFIGGDQRWLAMAGYTREQEDQLFERIRWPVNGYDLFRIGAPIGENPEPWFDGLSESNCLLLPTTLYDRIGGFDEAFDQAGGGFANLDLWRRASQAASGSLVALIGEASFHQFHGGTTTNVDDDEKDLRVRGYANAYRSLRGDDYAGVHRSNLHFRGRMRSEFATGVRQRTLLPMRLGITDQVRPGQLALHFDEGAQAHLQSVYAECALQGEVRWLGQPAGVAPADLLSVQEIIDQLRPDAIVAVGADAGLVGFINSVLCALDAAANARILYVNPTSAPASSWTRVTVLDGPPAAEAVLAAARQWVGSAETVLVLHATGLAETFSPASLQAYAALVSHRSYLICLGTLFGQPWLGYSSHQHLQAIRDFSAGDSPFVIDRSWNRQLISTCPSGYLRKVGGAVTAANYDPALDILALAQPPLPENLQ
jgi:cephalosporin hydroxylase/glycosyltransferase involved in cell wall biosynthesis